MSMGESYLCDVTLSMKGNKTTALEIDQIKKNGNTSILYGILSFINQFSM